MPDGDDKECSNIEDPEKMTEKEKDDVAEKVGEAIEIGNQKAEDEKAAAEAKKAKETKAKDGKAAGAKDAKAGDAKKGKMPAFLSLFQLPIAPLRSTSCLLPVLYDNQSG